MKLNDLLPILLPRETSGDLGVDVRHVRCDSRRVGPGDLYAAVRNVYVDGHEHVGDAIARGAAAVLLSERPPEPLSVPWVRTHSVQEVLGPAAARLWGDPSRQQRLVGVTGTNGKTTTTWMLEAILAAAGRRPGLIGTTGVRFAGRELSTGLTTPEAPELQEILAEMLAAGVDTPVMEVSSHGIALRRVAGASFAVGVLTGLGRDHLDFHGDQQTYRDTKTSWLLELQQSPTRKGIVVPADDEAGREVMQEYRGNILSFGFDDEADISPSVLDLTAAGARGRVSTPWGTLTLDLRVPGRHNVRNAMAAAGAALLLEIEPIAIVEGWQRFGGVPGRLQRVPNGRGLEVLVDYAHTPDALEAVVASLREVTKGRLIVVFGCGGDRDRQKRPEMARVVYGGADAMVVTSDNPRSEAPHAIIDDILMGVPVDADPERVHVEADRRAAIALAIELAEPGDTVLIAGKGHETTQTIGTTALPFDDRLVAAEVLGS